MYRLIEHPITYLLFSIGLHFSTMIFEIFNAMELMGSTIDEASMNKLGDLLLIQNMVLALLASPLVLVTSLNLLLAFMLGLYHILHAAFFARPNTPTEQRFVVEKLFKFISFKVVLIGLILEPSFVDVGLWIVWSMTLAIVKGILYHGLLYLRSLFDEPSSFRISKVFR